MEWVHSLQQKDKGITTVLRKKSHRVLVSVCITFASMRQLILTILFKDYFMSTTFCLAVCMCATCVTGGEEVRRQLQIPGTGVVGGCAGNQARLLCKSNKCSELIGPPSPQALILTSSVWCSLLFLHPCPSHLRGSIFPWFSWLSRAHSVSSFLRFCLFWTVPEAVVLLYLAGILRVYSLFPGA